MRRESTNESMFFFKNNLFEFNRSLEFILIEDGATRIDLSSVFVFVSPDARRPVVFQCEAQGVDPLVTTGAVFALPVVRKSFTYGQFLELFLVGFG